ncbi:glycohydrolase toxin TNT-related protein [Pseudoalteromonas sp.]|uniref:glycohydrolase toxin TNT-related protein n=1 Tax=Pseudoalteromonas sp. TaxID=53249 RepID=UPI001BCECC4C|nr:glycohydrolase toxin TNT-related protein [Pseudoalteromonas sp.]
MTQGDGLTSVSYNAMDKPTQIIKSGKTLNFTYGPQHMRFKQVNGSVTTYYSDKLYEEEVTGTKTTWRAYIDDIAVISQTTNEGATIRYTHRDRLGSARVFTDHNGQVEAERNFDPFGKPRLASGGLKSFGNSKLDDLADAKTNRGFTDHEHLDSVELIHMNGLVYDYNLGRFMSVDPLIQSPTNSQSINPYSYIMNNPLSGADPTGYCSTDDSLKDCAGGLEEGKTQAITNADGKTVGHVGKDSQGNVHITNNGSSKGQAAIAGSLKSMDIGSQKKVAQQPLSGGVGRRSEASQIIANSGIDFEAEKEAIDSGGLVGVPAGEMLASRSRRTSSSTDYFQPLINGQVQMLINQIQSINPSYRYQTVRPTSGRGSQYNRGDITYLQGVLAGMRQPIAWPPNSGFQGPVQNMTLPVGTRIDRYGSNGGFFISPIGTPFGQRSLPEFSRGTPYRIFEVLKPINVRGGAIAPAFGQPGGGVQYILPQRVGGLVQSGHLRVVEK